MAPRVSLCCLMSLVGVSCIGSAQPNKRGQDPLRVDLCSIVKNPRAFSGKTVQVDGVYYIAAGAIINTECTPMVTYGYAWPKGLSLSSAQKGMDLWLRAVEMAKIGRSDKICLRLVGTIEAKKQYEVMTLPDGKRHGYGFGHLSKFPGHLQIDEVLWAGACDDVGRPQ